MTINQAFGRALRDLRKQAGLSQEDFGGVSSRTYVSSLERGLKSPTLEKACDLAEFANIDPLELFARTMAEHRKLPVQRVVTQLLAQLQADADDSK